MEEWKEGSTYKRREKGKLGVEKVKRRNRRKA